MKYTVERKPLVQRDVAPVQAVFTDDGTLFLDFGKAAFGTLLMPSTPGQSQMVVHLGEKLSPQGRLDRNPPGAIRYIRIAQEPNSGGNATRITIPLNERNTGPGAIKMPDEIGEVYPFRYAEIEQAEGIDASAIRQVCVHYPFDDDAAAFQSSDSVLDAVWELCKYSIKATTFCGVYVDGDRERIPYEGDAYLNQLCHYCVDREYALARYTHEYLIQYPTWPTEWHLHSVMMAWADYLYTGETISIETFYGDLCAKTLIDLARPDGLISTQSDLCTRAFEERLHLYHDRYVFKHGLRDLVDWPPGSFTDGGQGERDNHEMMPVNTVVNAFHCHALRQMSQIAQVLGRDADQLRFAKQAERARASMNRLLFDRDRGVYVDGEGSKHASLHSNMLMLAFDLVPQEYLRSVVDFVKSRGMACSVYGAQYLLEALYRHGEDRYALDLITARHDRSWWHMLEVGSTVTMEAWDWKYKNNLDWNHAWGAVPANIIPRYLLGVRPLEPGFKKAIIQPQPGWLKHAEGRIPTRLGAIDVALKQDEEYCLDMKFDIPANMTAMVGLPQGNSRSSLLVLDGKKKNARLQGKHLFLDDIGPGSHQLTCK